MNLNILWFILVGTLFTVYFLLDGVTFGIGMLVPFLGKDDKTNRKMINAVGPTWGASEVWLLTAGGAMFASFPGWYATMFSGFYPALFILIAALIVRGLCIEFREKALSENSKRRYDIGLGIGNLLIPLLLVVALACLLRGVPIDGSGEFTGTLFSLFSPFTLLAGLTGIAFFLYHGSVVLELKYQGEITGVAKVAERAGIAAIVLLVLTTVAAAIETDLLKNPVSIIFAILSIVLFVLSCLTARKKAKLLVLVINALVIASAVITLFSAMFPRVMVSSTSADNSLTIYTASSSPYTLTVISFVTLTLLPIVIGYTIWTHYVFAKKIEEEITY